MSEKHSFNTSVFYMTSSELILDGKIIDILCFDLQRVLTDQTKRRNRLFASDK